MKEKTRLLFDRLEAKRGRIIKQYGRLTPAQLQFKADPNEWNLLQVMRHLVTAEQQSVKLILRKLQQQDKISRTGFGAKFRHLVLKIALRLPLKFKAPKIAEVHEESPDFNQMKSEWETVREEILTIIEESTSETLSKALYRHPRAGYLNVKQALEFMDEHLTHHQKQIDRLVDQSNNLPHQKS
ncbi:DinB family protein [Rhodohalobacter sp. SW132]|uniref:DinB family protein n=1 Tax=Rhodohalobacter sp. SW132 TaxID=2293433 RepID=UPI000E225A7E|nr:DinB family protein [Rhodohalobacter sp. SW132]REL38973.1 DinB family protein [Rhodohalobacter sp. SW132]